MDFRNASLVWTSFEIQEGQRPSAMIGIGVLILLTLVLVYSTKSRVRYSNYVIALSLVLIEY